MADALGSRLVQLAGESRRELLLVAPYIKVGALVRVLSACPRGVPVRVVTRWRIEEIAMGVSDLEIWPLLRDRGDHLWLHAQLHAKYYRGDEAVLIGSANLTDTALGWRVEPNLEILLQDNSNKNAHVDFEQTLWAQASPVDDRLHGAFVDALALFPTPPADSSGPRAGETTLTLDKWRPALRHPEDLLVAYIGKIEDLTMAAREAATSDLEALSPPAGLTRPQFKAWVGLQLRLHAEVRAIDEFLTQSRRFGEIRDLLAKLGADDGSRAWQTWMRWLLHFLPADYEMAVANYSEIFRRRLPEGQ